MVIPECRQSPWMSSRGGGRLEFCGCIATAELVPDQLGLPAVLKIRDATQSGNGRD